MKTCQTCLSWTRIDEPEACDPIANIITNPSQVGHCDQIRFVTTFNGVFSAFNGVFSSAPASLNHISCWAPNSEQVSAITGPNFGCIHWSPKP